MIKTQNLTHVYSPDTPFVKSAVTDVSLHIPAGELVGVIGHTGSGKSTLIQHFNGLLKPTSGKVMIDGEDIWEHPAKIRQVRFKVGLVFQYPEYQLFEETVYKDIAFGPKNMGLDEDAVNLRVREAARFVGLREDHMQKSPFDLSGGQKRRAAIAGVLAMEPKVLILDEPTAGLDPRGRDKILGEIREYHQERKNTVLLVSHSMEDIARYCKKALVMNKSRLYMYDTVEAVFEKSSELSGMGLSVPQITRICMSLHDMGFAIPPHLYTVQSAKEQILGSLSKGRCSRA